MEQQYLYSDADHNALNVKLEDFSSNFTDTVRRIFQLGCYLDSAFNFCLSAATIFPRTHLTPLVKEAFHLFTFLT